MALCHAEKMLVAEPSTQTFEWVDTFPSSISLTGDNVFQKDFRIQRITSGENIDINLLNENAEVRSRLRLVGDSHALSFWTAGAERMRITEAGNVGIGTSVATERMTVEGNILMLGTDLRLFHPDRAGGNWHSGRALVHSVWDILDVNWGGDFTGGVRIATSQTRIDGALGVGIAGNVGATPNNHGQTTFPDLHVLNGAPIAGNGEVVRLERYNNGQDIVEGAAGSVGMYLNDEDGGGGEVARISWEHDGVGPDSDEGNGMIKFWTSNVGGTNSVPAPRMTIRRTGDVGIGTMDPNGKLHVTGATTITADGNALNLIPETSGSHTVWNFHSRVNLNSDRGFLLAQDNSELLGPPGSGQNFRLTLGVHNDIGNLHRDQLWLQGGHALVQNVGAWDSEMNTLIGTPGMSETESQKFEWRIHNELKMQLSNDGLYLAEKGTVGQHGYDWNTGMVWTPRVAAMGGTSVAFGNGRFVAVIDQNQDNRVMTSPDGITWTARTAAAPNSWRYITYGNGLFAAIAYSGSGNRIMTSPDGITWTTRSSPADNNWVCITYGNQRFVAVSRDNPGNQVMTSDDGIGWKLESSPGGDWVSVTFGQGLFVAVALSSSSLNRVMTSPDGIAWTARSAPNREWTSVTFGDGYFVAVGWSGSGDRVMTSTNGIDWTLGRSAADNSWDCVAYGNGQFVAVSRTGDANRVMTSSDHGATWSFPMLPGGVADWMQNQWIGLTFGNGMFVAVSIDGSNNRVMTSGSIVQAFQPTLTVDNNIQVGSFDPTSTARTWTSRSSAANNEWIGVTYGNGMFVAIARTGSGNRIMTSADGMAWTTRTTNNNIWRAVTYGNGLFVAVSSDGVGNRVMTSPDGITWTSRMSAADNQWYAVTYGNGLFVAVGITGAGNRVMTSPNGINWTIRTSAADNQWIGVAYGNGLFVAISFDGSGNRAMSSPDGVTWTIGTTKDYQWRAITFGNGIFVAVSVSGEGDRVMTSSNGITWTSRSSAADNGWRSVTFGDGIFVAVSSSGSNDRAMTSPDGILWTLQSTNNNGWHGVCYGNGMFVAVSISGSSDRVMTLQTTTTPTYVGLTAHNLIVEGSIRAAPTQFLLSLLSGWINYFDAAGVYGLASYTKVAGVVYVTGLVRRPDLQVFQPAHGSSAAIIGYLPVGFRPRLRELFFSISPNDIFARIDVYVEGAIYLEYGNTDYVSLSEISFLAND